MSPVCTLVFGDQTVLLFERGQGELADATTQALLVVQSEHLPRLVDIGATPTRQLLVFEPLRGVTLAEVLSRRGGVTLGEAVTILVALGRADRALRRRGYRWRVDAALVAFDRDGTPLVAGPFERLDETAELQSDDDYLVLEDALFDLAAPAPIEIGGAAEIDAGGR